MVDIGIAFPWKMYRTDNLLCISVTLDALLSVADSKRSMCDLANFHTNHFCIGGKVEKHFTNNSHNHF